MIDFDLIRLERPGNQFLLMPARFMEQSGAQMESPVWEAAPSRLIEALLEVARAEGRLVVKEQDNTGFEAVQRTAVFRFPDDVSARAFNAGPGKSALGIFSRSRYGLSDLGANRRRVLRWLQALEEKLGAS